MGHHNATTDHSTRTVDALATAIFLLMVNNLITEAWILYGLAPEPARLSMRLRCILTVAVPQSPPSRHSTPGRRSQDEPT